MTSKEQITIPKKIRALLGIKEGDQLRFSVEKDAIGSVVVNEPIDLEHMREITQKQIAHTIYREELGESGEKV